jgi:hypothetical protein
MNQTNGSPQRRIIAILPRGEAIRNFVYTGALQAVAERVPLSVLSVYPNASIWSELETVFDDVRPLEEVPERWVVRWQRGLLDVAHGRRLWSEAAQERWRLRDREANSPLQKGKRLGWKVASLPFANQPGLKLLERFDGFATHALRTTNKYVDLLGELRPALVFNGSHVHSRNTIPVINAARHLEIPTAAFIFSWDNLTSQGRIIPSYDHYFVWNDLLKDQLLSIYPSISPGQVYVTGTPQFDLHFRGDTYWTREHFCRVVGADPARPIVLYTTGMANHMPGEPEIVQQIADVLTTMPEHGPPQLLVRVYPKDRTGRFDEVKDRRKDILFPGAAWESNWLTPGREDAYLLANTLRHSAVGVNVASTVSLELCMFDKPVINIGYNPPSVDPGELSYARYYSFDHYRPIVESGAVDVIFKLDKLRVSLLEALTNSQLRRHARQRLMNSFFGTTLDGRSAQRVAKALIELASRRSERVPAS